MSTIKLQMEEAKREMDAVASSSASRHHLNGFGTIRAAPPFGRQVDHDDFDDGASVASVETVTMDAGGGDDASDVRSLQHVGPRAPPDMPAHLTSQDAADLEPARAPEVSPASEADAATALSTTDAQPGTHTDDSSALTQHNLAKQNGERDLELRAQNEALSARLEQLASQLEQALSLSRGLQEQHAQVTDTVKTLEQRVHTLEREVEHKTASMTSANDASQQSTAALLNGFESRWTEFRTEFDESWRKEREGLQTERDELRQVVRAWDEANRRMEDELNTELDAHAEDTDSIGSAASASNLDAAASASSSSASQAAVASDASAGRSKRGHGRRKRHVNSALRTLLYGSTSAGLMLGAGGREHDEEDEWDAATRARLSRRSPDEDAMSTSQSVRSVADSTSTRPSTSTEVTTPELGADTCRGETLEIDHTKHEGSHPGSRQLRHAAAAAAAGTGESSRHVNVVGPQTLAAAGVVFVGMAAFILAGKDLSRFNGALSGKP